MDSVGCSTGASTRGGPPAPREHQLINHTPPCKLLKVVPYIYIIIMCVCYSTCVYSYVCCQLSRDKTFHLILEHISVN